MGKVIDIPPDLALKDFPDTAEAKFKGFLGRAIDAYTEGVKTVSQLRQAQKVVDVIENANGTIALEDAEYTFLKGAVDSFPSKLRPGYGRLLLPFFDAFEKAQDVKLTAEKK